MIDLNVKNLLNQIPKTNPYGEKVTLVAAIKLQDVHSINTAVSAGITDVGDNHVQEFREKYEFITGNPRRHFIGHLQTNKVKYLIGKIDLYHSVDRFNLAEELSRRSEKAGVTSDILLQINIGNEQSKGGFDFKDAIPAYEKIKQLPALKITGLMAMLPADGDTAYLTSLAVKMRSLYERIRKTDANFMHLSMGMSGDWQLCVNAGSNMVRLGTSIFGERNYTK